FLEKAGLFVWPLAGLSLLAVFVIVERLLALRPGRIMPRSLVEQLIAGSIDRTGADLTTAGGRILAFFRRNNPDAEGLKAYAQLEITRMERGMFLLDIVIAAAPLLGLLGTVTGLVSVFSNFSPETGMPDPGAFIQGIGLALTTTILGLAIAIPALIGNAYLNRRVDNLAARVNVAVERLLDLHRRGVPIGPQNPPPTPER
ncbi:MAG: MotA/TolQ/ExbB proton channel family protein, partial [Verrucomicrobiota bacterium]